MTSVPTRYRVALSIAATAAFVVVAFLVSIRPLIAGADPAGTAPQGPLATLSVRNADGRSGIRATSLESFRAIGGVQSIHYARAVLVAVMHADHEVEAPAAFVNDQYFRSLGVVVHGPGFSGFSPWQRNVARECVVGSSLAGELGHGPSLSLVGRDIEVNQVPCRVVGIADAAFSGMRPPRITRLWISWPSQIGLGIPDVAPEDFLDLEFRAIEVGFVRNPDVPLGAVQAAVENLLQKRKDARADVRILPGDGLEPGPRHRMLREVRLMVLAIGVLLSILLAFAVIYSLWYSESVRATQGIRRALGATTRRLALDSIKSTSMQIAASLCLGLVFGSVIWNAVIARYQPELEQLQLPSRLPIDAGLWGALTVLLMGIVTGMTEVQAWLRYRNSDLAWTIRKFGKTSEWLIVAFIIAATFSGAILTSWIVDDYKRLSQLPRGYGNSDAVILAFDSGLPAAMFRAPTRAGFSGAAVMQVLDPAGTGDRVAFSQSVPHRPARGYRVIQRPVSSEVRGSVLMSTNLVTGNFFDFYKIRILEGSSFTTSGSLEAVLSESAAKDLLGDAPWVGRNISLDSDRMMGGSRVVVGVVSDVAYQGRNGAIGPTLYLPTQDMSDVYAISLADTASMGTGHVAELLGRMGIKDSFEPPVRVSDLDDRDDQSGRTRASVLLATCLLAIALGAIGLGEILLVVAGRRLPELALRSALGATFAQLVWTAFRKQAPALGAGLVVGSVVFYATIAYLQTKTYDLVLPHQSTLFKAALALIIIVGAATVPGLISIRSIPISKLLKSD